MSTSEESPDLEPCPCCDTATISERGEYEVCGLCGWEDDPVQSEDPDYAGGANRLSLNQARQEWFSNRERQQN